MAGSFLDSKASNTPPLYRFQLYNTKTRELITLKNEPIGWKTGVIQVERDIKIGGVFTSFVVQSLVFIKEGADFLRKIWIEKEVNGTCELIVSWYKFSVRDYVEMPSRFSLNFGTCKPKVKIGTVAIGFQIDTVKKSELVKLENRRNEKVDISRFVSMGGDPLLPYVSLNGPITFGEFNIQTTSVWISDYIGTQEIDNQLSVPLYNFPQMTLSSNEIPTSINVAYAHGLASAAYHFFENTDSDINISLYYRVQVTTTNRKGNIFNPQDVYHLYLEKDFPSGKTLDELGVFGGHEVTDTFADTINVTVPTNGKLRLYVLTDATDNVDAHFDSCYVSIYESIANTDARVVWSIPVYEAFEQSLRMIMDTQYPFYSEYFGRTDVWYNLAQDTYLSENQLRFCNILSGLNLRGGALFDDNIPLSISFDQLFKSINALYNIGYELEFRDNFYRIRIENYDYFFEDTEVLDLSGRINKYDIETEVIPDLVYSSFESGYKDYEYEEANGRGEYNTNNLRTSVLNINSKFDNISELRADTKGITAKLAQELTTTDSKEDNELFIVKTQRDGSYGWVPETDENIAIEENSSLFLEQSLNLYFTPSRNLIRHGNRIKGSFLKYLSTSLRFQTSGKLQTLKTTGEGYTITENEDILINGLSDAIFKPIKHTVTCKFSFTDLETLMATPKGYIKISDEISGYLLNLKKTNEEDKATIEIIEKC